MSKAKGKTLVQILAEELKKWPECKCLAQDKDSEVYGWSANPEFGYDQWLVSDVAGVVVCRPVSIDLASDYSTAIVTRAQWEAERAKLSKPKTNKDGWIRHRGGKCPVADGVRVDYRMRSGSVGVNVRAELLDWGRGDVLPGSDIMAYRISQPDQQAIEKAFDMCVEKCASTEPGHVEMPAPIDGPLQWRDRINAIDAEEARLNTEHRNAIEALEEERVSLVQRLAGEGLQLIGEKADKGESLPDMSNPDNWKAGDLVVSLEESDSSYFKVGGIYTLREDCEFGNVRVKRDEAGQENGWDAHNFKWHSRPTNNPV